ncbi:MAG: ribosome biogenesis GTPase Der [Deltaproteobacteria bacterium]|nr:ribosome biogenesis GTPase Der [Deltaproteobacteria bacterium]
MSAKSEEKEAQEPLPSSFAQRRRRGESLPAQARGTLPIVAIVGRPNVGKSTLFNRLAKAPLAIVEDTPGVTRDRHYADAFIRGRAVALVDTGGFDPYTEDPLRVGIARHVKAALEEADLVVCVFDASSPPTPADWECAQLLRESKKPVIYVANKADTRSRVLEASAELYALGIDRLIPISALHGANLVELEEAIAKALPPSSAQAASIPIEEDAYRIAIIGRPNVGKSSLVNRLLGEERQLVDPRPGTTVDAIDSLLIRTTPDGKTRSFVLIDTAGIRRKKNVEAGVESLAVMKAIRAINRCDCAVLLVDVQEGVRAQDARLAGLAVERGKALVVGLNKADLLQDKEASLRAIEQAKEALSFARWAPIVLLSAHTGKRAFRILEEASKAIDSHRKRITTGELNRFFTEVLERHPPPTHRGRSVRLYYITQVEIAPPTFVLMTNAPEAIHFSYERYVINSLRERFGFYGTPIRVLYRGKQGKE